VLNLILDDFDLTPSENSNYFDLIKSKNVNDIKNLNHHQLKNITPKIDSEGFSDEVIKAPLKFYKIKKGYFKLFPLVFNL
tara:strand:+ start:932 stop:1171 length:240 start_codon:yes stop_codon:yes gene_type:complete